MTREAKNNTTLEHSHIGVEHIPLRRALVHGKFIIQWWRLLFAVGGIRNTDMIKAVPWLGKPK